MRLIPIMMNGRFPNLLSLHRLPKLECLGQLHLIEREHEGGNDRQCQKTRFGC
jgi:hypothetical protein